MNPFRILLALGLLLATTLTFAAEPSAMPTPQPAKPSDPTVLAQSIVPLGSATEPTCMLCSGFFFGLGGSYNSIKLDENYSGSANMDVSTGATLVASGSVGGPAAPYHSTLSTLAPAVQLGCIRTLDGSAWSWGSKFSYKYLGLTFTNSDIASPQAVINPEPGASEVMVGHVVGDSAQTSVNHELAWMPYVGRSFNRGRVYLGGGPVVFGTQSRINQATGYADLNGVHQDIIGTPLNFSSSTWMWGGAAQIGLVYYLGASCFLDASYDIMVTGAYTQNYTAPFTNDSGFYTTVGTLNITTVQRITAQSIGLTFNLLF